MQPIVLPPNQLHRFYKGGRRIRELRGSGSDDPYSPEEWIASMTSPFGEPGVGIATLPDGTALPEAITADPEGYLGPRHVARFGPEVAVLIKLLDAGERLPVHLHPDDDFARAHLDSKYGKTEAWIILEADEGAAVQVGLRDDVTLEDLERWVDAQDSDALLSALNRITVAAGDTIFVPAGTPHAIGGGILLAELQQPTDFSLLLEWKGFAPDAEAASLGLGFDTALQAVKLDPWTKDDLARAGSTRTAGPGMESLFPAEADAFFRAERLAQGAQLEQGFAVLLAIGGSGALRGEGWDLQLTKGDAVLIPYSAGRCGLEGPVQALRCMPPDPAAAG